MDTKVLEKGLAQLKSMMQGMTEAIDGLTGCPQSHIDSLKTVGEAYTQLFIVLRQAMCLWHLECDAEPDLIRRRLQHEVKTIKAAKLEEKVVLPQPLFKMTWDRLSCKL